MMNPVHARRDNDQIENPLQLYRQSPVGMMKKRCSFECDEEDDQHNRRDAANHPGKRAKADGKNKLPKMESPGGAHVEVKIGVMLAMRTPKNRPHTISPNP